MEQQKKRRPIWSNLVLVAALPLVMGASGCPNAFKESANKTSDAALAFSAEIHANANEWTEAIADMSAMSTAGRAQRENKTALGSYYAGRCGLRLLPFAKSVTDGLATNKILSVVMTSTAAATALQFADCVAAETAILSISATAASRTPNENVLLTFVELAKMGTALGSAAGIDTDHDGTINGTPDVCNSTVISDLSVQQIGTGLTIALSSMQSAGTSIAGTASASLSAMCAAADTALGNPPSGPHFCDKMLTSDFTGASLLALRSLIKSNEIGFNTCGGPLGQDNAGTASDCICPVTP